MNWANLNDDEFLDWFNDKFKDPLIGDDTLPRRRHIVCMPIHKFILFRKCMRRRCAKRLNFVNTVFKGCLPYRVCLLKLFSTLQSYNCKYYKNQPQMLTLQVLNNVKLILFASGKYRLMGKFHPTKSCLLKLLKSCKNIKLVRNLLKHKSTLAWQTSTVAFKLHKMVNLQRLYEHLLAKKYKRCVGYYELESFPALAIKLWSPLHVNVFSSGNVVITGVTARHLHLCNHIHRFLYKRLKIC